jgi:hypothetical protein
MFETDIIQRATPGRQRKQAPLLDPTPPGAAAGDTFVRTSAALPSLSEELISLGCTVSDREPPGPNKLGVPDLQLLVRRDPQTPTDWVRLHVSRNGLGRASCALRHLLQGGPALPGAVLRGRELKLEHPAASADVAFKLFAWLYYDRQPPGIGDAVAVYALATALSAGAAPQGTWATLSNEARAMLCLPRVYDGFAEMLAQATRLGHTASADALAQMLMKLMPEMAARYIDALPAPLRSFLLVAPFWKEKPAARDHILERCETANLMASMAWYGLSDTSLLEKIDRLYTEPEAACVLWARLAVGAQVASLGQSKADLRRAEASRRLAAWGTMAGHLAADFSQNAVLQISLFYASYLSSAIAGSAAIDRIDSITRWPCPRQVPLHLGLAGAGIEAAMWNALFRQQCGEPPRMIDETSLHAELCVKELLIGLTASVGVLLGAVVGGIAGALCESETTRIQRAAPCASAIMAVVWGLIYGLIAVGKYNKPVAAIMTKHPDPLLPLPQAVPVWGSSSTHVIEDVQVVGRPDADFHIVVRADANCDTHWCRIPVVREQLIYASDLFQERFAIEGLPEQTVAPRSEWTWDEPAATRDVAMQLLDVMHDKPVNPSLQDSPALIALIGYLNPPAVGPGRNACLRELSAKAQACVDAALPHRANAVGLLQRILDAKGEVPDSLPGVLCDLTEQERRDLRSCDLRFLVNCPLEDNKKAELLIELAKKVNSLPTVEECPGRATIRPKSLRLDVFLRSVEAGVFDLARTLTELKRRTKEQEGPPQSPPPGPSTRVEIQKLLVQHMRHQQLESDSQSKILG